MKRIVSEIDMFHRSSAADYCISAPHWASSHLDISYWLKKNIETASYEEYRKECSKNGIIYFSEECYNASKKFVQEQHAGIDLS